MKFALTCITVALSLSLAQAAEFCGTLTMKSPCGTYSCPEYHLYDPNYEHGVNPYIIDFANTQAHQQADEYIFNLTTHVCLIGDVNARLPYVLLVQNVMLP